MSHRSRETSQPSSASSKNQPSVAELQSDLKDTAWLKQIERDRTEASAYLSRLTDNSLSLSYALESRKNRGREDPEFVGNPSTIMPSTPLQVGLTKSALSQLRYGKERLGDAEYWLNKGYEYSNEQVKNVKSLRSYVESKEGAEGYAESLVKDTMLSLLASELSTQTMWAASAEPDETIKKGSLSRGLKQRMRNYLKLGTVDEVVVLRRRAMHSVMHCDLQAAYASETSRDGHKHRDGNQAWESFRASRARYNIFSEKNGTGLKTRTGAMVGSDLYCDAVHPNSRPGDDHVVCGDPTHRTRGELYNLRNVKGP